MRKIREKTIMKYAFAVVLMLTLAAGTAMAGSVDFNQVLVSQSIISPASYPTVEGVTFTYNPLLDSAFPFGVIGTDSADISNGGILIAPGAVPAPGTLAGTLTGTLEMDFNVPIYQLSFTFTVLDDPLQIFNPGAFVIINDAFNTFQIVVTDSSGLGVASLESNAPFTQALVTMPTDPNMGFALTDVTFDSPEPVSFLMIGGGLLGLGLVKRLRRAA
jgi:hypothetical protein